MINLSDREEKEFQKWWKSDPDIQAWKASLKAEDEKNLINEGYSPQQAKKMSRSPSYDYPQKMIDAGNYYDYRKAWKSGDSPKVNKHDGKYHWGSSGKAVNHPTAWKESYLKVTGKNPDEFGISEEQGMETLKNYHSLIINKFLSPPKNNQYLFNKFNQL
jgi:hypothetical protein